MHRYTIVVGPLCVPPVHAPACTPTVSLFAPGNNYFRAFSERRRHGFTVVGPHDSPCLLQALEAPGGMEHPGLLHLYCHLMELSDEPTAAMPAANVLRTLFPLAGHLTHMASHIDIWAGHYKVRKKSCLMNGWLLFRFHLLRGFVPKKLVS